MGLHIKNAKNFKITKQGTFSITLENLNEEQAFEIMEKYFEKAN